MIDCPAWRALIVILLLAAAACSRPAREAREFKRAYPAQAVPSGTLREFKIEARPAVVPLIDGKPLKVWSYNGLVPGPTLRVRLGDTLRVKFTNRLPQPTTIHWHGMRVPNAMDGVPGVTQPAVEPGGSFVYEFTPKDAGTFWFHPHIRSSEQVERGLFGVVVVEDREPLPYSRDVVWVLDDWLLTPTGEIYPEFNTRHDLAHDGRWGNVVTVNGDRNEQLVVRPGERIRLRLVNVANGRVFAPDFGELNAKVIAVDGMYTAAPMKASGFELAPGNRLDLDITVGASDAGRQFAVIDGFFARQPNRLAEIVVAGDRVETPGFIAPTAAHMPEWRDTLTMAPSVEYRLNARRGGEFGIEWTLNGRAMSHATHSESHDTRTLPLGEFAKIRYVNESYRLHPMHIHGLFFKVLTRNGVAAEEPFWRDTVLVHAKETVDIGTVPLDPGRWMLHCHILEHAESGMMTLIEVK